MRICSRRMELAPTCSEGCAGSSWSGYGIFCSSGPEEMELGLELSGLNGGHGVDEAQKGAENGGGDELHGRKNWW